MILRYGRKSLRTRNLIFVGGLAFLILTTGAAPAYITPGDAPPFSYDAYATVLKKFVNEQALVNYAALKTDRGGLDTFVSSLGALTASSYETWDEKTKIAFWCNAYNAITLKYIIDHYPIQKGSWLNSVRFPSNSIRQIAGVWDTLTTPVMGKDMTLDAIEHDVLRKQFTEPRIHMAIVCAAMGCPPLRSEPYAGDGLDQQLDDQSQRFISNHKKFLIDAKKDLVYLSPIFKWFGSDFAPKYAPASGFDTFGSTERAVLNFVSQYIPASNREYLLRGKYSVHYLDYDWSLNEQK